MSIAAARDEVMRLDAERRRLLAELELVSSTSPLPSDAPLVDEEGFPRADANIFSVREARQRAVMLRNDCRAVDAALAVALEKLHAAQALAGSAKLPPAQEAPSSKLHEAPASLQAPAPISWGQPFARVGSVSARSPAAVAGLQPGDRLVAVGILAVADAGGLAPTLQTVAHEVASARNGSLPVVVLRRGHAGEDEIVSLLVRPREWVGGQGLLGCMLLPL